MWELEHKEGWAPKNWCFWTVVLEKTLESPLDCKEIRPVNSIVQSLSRVWLSGTWVLQLARFLCPSPARGACSNSCPSTWGCHPSISSYVVYFSSCFQSFPASRSFPMSQSFTSGGQSTGVSVSTSVPSNEFSGVISWCWNWNSSILATWCEELTHWRDPDAGKDWRQEEKGMTEDEMVGWHHWLSGHEFEQAPGVGDGQGSLACCSPQGPKESDTTEQLNNNVKKLKNSLLVWFCKSVSDTCNEIYLCLSPKGRKPVLYNEPPFLLVYVTFRGPGIIYTLSNTGEGSGNTLQYSCLKNPMDREAWWVTVHGVTELDMTEHRAPFPLSNTTVHPCCVVLCNVSTCIH